MGSFDEESSKLINLQDYLCDIKEDKSSFYYEQIYNLKLPTIILIQEILLAIPIRPSLSDLFYGLIKYLSEKSEYSSILERLLEYVIIELNNKSFFDQYLSSYVFLRLCYEKGLYTSQDIKEKALEYISEPSCYHYCYPYALIAFLDIFSTHGFFSLHNRLRKPGIFIDKLFKLPDIHRIVIYDDIERFLQISSVPDFDIDMLLDPLHFSLSPLFRKRFRLVHLCAFYGSEKLFRHLIVSGSIIKNLGPYAIAGGSFGIIRVLDQLNYPLSECLDVAIEYRRYDIYRWIITNYFNGNQNDILVHSFKKALEYNSLKLVFRLLNQSIVLPSNETPLFVSSSFGYIALTNFLLEYYPQFHHQLSKEEYAAIHIAAHNNHFLIVKMMVKKDAKMATISPPQRGSCFISALTQLNIRICSFIANFNSNYSIEILESMIIKNFSGLPIKPMVNYYNGIFVDENGIDINHYIETPINKDGGIPLQSFHIWNQKNLLNKLFSMKNFNINAQNYNGETFLHQYIDYCWKTKYVSQVIMHPNADSTIEDYKGRCPLSMVVDSSKLSILKDIVSCLNHQKCKRSLFEYELNKIIDCMLKAIYNHNSGFFINCLQIQLIDINMIHANGNTFLHLSVTQNSVDITRALLEDPRIDPNIPNKNGMTPVRYTENAFNEIFIMFLSNPKVNLSMIDETMKNYKFYIEYKKKHPS